MILFSWVEERIGKLRFSSFFPQYTEFDYINRETNFNLFPFGHSRNQALVDAVTLDDAVGLELEEIESIIASTPNVDREEFLVFNPLGWVNLIKGLEEQVLKINITYPELSGIFFITDFMYKVVGGEGLDIQYTLELSEHIPAVIQSVRRYEFQTQYPNTTDSSRLFLLNENEYIVTEGDTLTTISRKTHFPIGQIRRFNAIRDSSIDLVVGRVLYLSDREAEPFTGGGGGGKE